MAGPKLDMPLVLEAPARVPDSGGGAGITWHAIGTLWAEMIPVSGREVVAGLREDARVSHRITVRAAPVGSPRLPRADCRFRLGARLFAIRGVAENDRRRGYLTCWAEEGAFS